jgi:hypothetical protein
MARRWSAAELLARAGGLTALLPYLIDGSIRARAEGFYTASGRPYNRTDPRVPAPWWEENPRVNDASTGRFWFAVGPAVAFDDHFHAEDIMAEGLEFEAAPALIEKLFPPLATPEPSATDPVAPPPAAAKPVKADLPPSPPKPAGRKHRRTGYDIWSDMHKYLVSVVADTGKKFASYRKVGDAGHNWAKEQQATRRKLKKGAAVPSIDTIREKASKLWPDLVEGNGE